MLIYQADETSKVWATKICFSSRDQDPENDQADEAPQAFPENQKDTLQTTIEGFQTLEGTESVETCEACRHDHNLTKKTGVTNT